MQSKADLLCVDPANVHQIWPLARPLIKAAIERTGLSDFDIIEAEVLKHDQLLWLAISDHVEAAATTQLIKANGDLVLIVTAVGGSQRDRWLPLSKQIEQYARNEGCKCVRIFGRKGWERVLQGYRAEHVILEKAL